MTDRDQWRRRPVVRTLVATAGVALAGCQALQGERSTAESTDSASDETDVPATEPSTETAALGSPPSLDVPAATRIAEKLSVTVDGLDPGTSVELAVRPTDPGLESFGWRREFTAGDDGRIEAFAGTDSDENEPRMILANFTGPEDRDLGPFTIQGNDELDLRVEVRRDGRPWAETTTTRVYQDPAVESEPVGADDLVGRVFEPTGDGPHPPVVVLHGSQGYVPHQYCRLLATHGYLALGLRYFGDDDGIPSNLVEIPLEYFERAVDWLRSRERARDDRIGLVGISRGVEPALLTAAAVDDRAAVVGYGGSGFVHQAPGVEAPAWTRDGEPTTDGDQWDELFSHIEESQEECGAVDCSYDDPGRPCETFACQLDHVRSTDQELFDELTIPVEEIDGPVTLHTGQEDSTWGAPIYSEAALYRHATHEHDYRFEHHSYPDAGHVFLRPYDHGPLKGGTKQANARASVQSWLQALDTLAAGLD